MHLIIDFRCRNQNLMRNQAALRQWLLAMVDKIGMTAFGEPTIVDYPFPEREGTALSAVCFLGESSIVIHTYPEFGAVFLDVFSCKDFNAPIALDYIDACWERVGPQQFFVLQRGIDMQTGEPVLLRLRAAREEIP